ncbi:MAG: hypothetical protein ACTSPL_04000 [Candidatus Odinarchaeia archaeon]
MGDGEGHSRKFWGAVAIVLVISAVGVSYAVFGAWWARIGSGINLTPAVYVNAEAYCREDLSNAAADVAVDVYDADMNLIETVTASSGKLTFGQMYETGAVLKLQPRPGNPSSSDPYLGEIYTFTVPYADAGDTVVIGTVYVKDPSETAPTMVIHDQSGATISDATANYFNTTDTKASITLSGLDDDTWWGMGDIVDQRTGKRWVGGIIVWKGTVTQAFTNAWLVVTNPSNVYYIFGPYQFADDASIDGDDTLTVVLECPSGFNADSSVVIDAYDIAEYNDIINGVFDDAEIDVTAITTKVA